MKVISEQEVLRQFTVVDAIKTIERCFIDFDRGRIMQWPRSVTTLPDGLNQNVFALMPAYLGGERLYGAKIMSFFPDNLEKSLPTHLGQIILLSSETGETKALIDANSVTWLRTAAVSAVATDKLAKKEASTLSLIGAGNQAASHLQAIRHVRPITRVVVFDLDKQRQHDFVERAKSDFPGLTILGAETLTEATENIDIICTLTPSMHPFLTGDMVSAGAHINAIGSFSPEKRELTTDLISAAKVFVDDYEAALKESGDILIPVLEGSFDEDLIAGSLSELVTSKVTGRSTENDITIFDAVGLAVEDLYCASAIYQKMTRMVK
ncbi:ornithine cyclodeaminase family protein [Weissella sp. LMG 11983]|uniref:ornithine cyclodeaminase family protein n=1 Tax=Weissella sp. LMG 11983 TaxID=2987700 RepID=UPI0021F82C07|nr:ornithine cyclodeaminase family protein [Weissella sp. LMG 11983]MCW0927913.1 ornithine cyclodeaminase family protein [Weissella sp. LMG 11983]